MSNVSPSNISLLDGIVRLTEKYIAARELCLKQQKRMRQHARELHAWLKSRADQSYTDSVSVIVSNWLNEIGMTYRRQAETVNGRRRSIISVLRFATPDGVPLPRVDRIRRQKVPDKLRLALTQDEIRRLLAAAPRYRPMTERTFGRGIAGDVIPRFRPDGIPWSHWWDAYIRVAYDSGQYLSDLRLLPWSSVGPDGAATFVRHKTGKMMSFPLGPVALAAARRLGHETLVLPWNFDLATYFVREFRKFVETVSGVRVLGPKSLRRSAITYTYIAQGEEAARILAGHSSFATTAKHYVDWSIARRPIRHE